EVAMFAPKATPVKLSELRLAAPKPADEIVSNLDAEPIDAEEANNRAVAATDVLSARRAELNLARRAVEAAHEKRRLAVASFNVGLYPCTPEQLRRQFIASEQATRAQRAAGLLPPRPGITPGRSEIDRQRAYARGSHSGNPGRAVVMGGTGERVHPASA